MFDRISLARLNICAANYLYPFFRRLRRVVSCRSVTSLWLLCLLYIVAEYAFSDFYFIFHRNVWKPAFPLSWRLLLVTLLMVPLIACVRVLWLSVYLLMLVYGWWRSKSRSYPSSSQGYTMLPRNEVHSLEGAVRDDEVLDPTEGESCIRRQPFPLTWSLRFFFWLGLFCVSYQLAFKFDHPGDVRYLPLIEHANAHPRREGYANNEKIFFAAMFSGHQHVIPYWSDSVIQVIHYLGRDNVFVSILESESKDESSALLQQLDDRLEAMNVPRRILTDDMAITKPNNMSDRKRIHYLAALRNRVLEPLAEMGGYDKVVFSNDVYVEPESIIELLKTADGEYDMACAMDFDNFGLYDLWVLRDKRGRLASSIWPYFFDQEDYEAMKNETAVPVFTCWNGIVVFVADPILPIHLRSNRTLSTDSLPLTLPVTHPAANDPSLLGPSPALTPPIGFRASAPGECFSSESFLLPYDFRRVFHLQRIFVNPRVIVGYAWRLYAYFKWFMRHPVLKWWVEQVYDGAWMHKGVYVVGDATRVSQWDGGDCHPW